MCFVLFFNIFFMKCFYCFVSHTRNVVFRKPLTSVLPICALMWYYSPSCSSLPQIPIQFILSMMICLTFMLGSLKYELCQGPSLSVTLSSFLRGLRISRAWRWTHGICSMSVWAHLSRHQRLNWPCSLELWTGTFLGCFSLCCIMFFFFLIGFQENTNPCFFVFLKQDSGHFFFCDRVRKI